MNGRPTTFAPWAGVALLATLLVAALLLAGCGSGGSGQANGQTVAGQVKTAVDDYTAKHGLAFDSSAAMTAFLEGAVPRAGVVDANTKPDADAGTQRKRRPERGPDDRPQCRAQPECGLRLEPGPGREPGTGRRIQP